MTKRDADAWRPGDLGLPEGMTFGCSAHLEGLESCHVCSRGFPLLRFEFGPEGAGVFAMCQECAIACDALLLPASASWSDAFLAGLNAWQKLHCGAPLEGLRSTGHAWHVVRELERGFSPLPLFLRRYASE